MTGYRQVTSHFATALGMTDYTRSSWLTPTVGDAVDATLAAVTAPLSAVPMAGDATPARAATPLEATRDAVGGLAMVDSAALAMSAAMPPRAAGRVVRARGAGATRTCPPPALTIFAVFYF